MRTWFCSFFIVSTLPIASASAQVFQAPVGGRPISLGDSLVACAASDGWTVESDAHSVRPPSSRDALGRTVQLRVAATPEACTSSTATLSVRTTDTWPRVDAASIVFSPDDGRLDLKGHSLAGMVVAWRNATAAGSDTCQDVKSEAGVERCAFSVGTAAATPAPLTTTFSFLPAGARTTADAVTFDADGRRATADTLALTPARAVLRRLLASDTSVDLSTGQADVPLVHPDAVASAECSGSLVCEMVSGKLIVHGAASLSSTADLQLRLRPHVSLAVKDTLDSQPAFKLPLLYCPMSIVSGPPIRENPDAVVIAKLEGACARDLSSVTFTTDHSELKAQRTLHVEPATYVVLHLGAVSDDELAITALRNQPNAVALAVAHTATRAAPQAHASIEVPGFPNLDFVPSNRPAIVHASALKDHEHLELLSTDGVYQAGHAAGAMTIRGDPNAAGLTSLRFGVRNSALPDGLSQIDLAIVTDPLQRPIHEANIPAPIGAASQSKAALIEMLCGGGSVPLERVRVGETAHLSFGLRDTCRVVFHRELLSSEYGAQKLNFEIDVIKADGGSRSDAHVSETLTFRSGPGPRYAYIHGVVDPFDRVVVRVSHEADEAHYIGASEIKTGSPAAQWSAVMGTGRARLYGTTTIPTGLYRFSTHEYSGALALNFGVISRLTWLDAEGHEGFLGAEAGVLVMGLANSTGPNGKSLTQVGGVVGLGFSVPIANRSTPTQASISLHAWLESDITRDPGAGSSGRYALIFGPSISIGNVGMNL